MLIATLLIIARTWTQPRCALMNEWVEQLWYICTLEHYSGMKRNTAESILVR